MRALLLLMLMLPVMAAASSSFVPPPALPTSPALAPCKTCGGEGKMWIDNPGIKTNRSYRYADEDKRLSGAASLRAQVTCKECKGRKKLVRELSMDELRQMQQTARQGFDKECLQKGLIPVAGGYMTRAEADALAPEAYAALAHSHPKACTACLGLKREMCRKCKGEGVLLHREKDAKGREEIIEETCKTCTRRGSVPCRKCEGEGLLKLCKKCQGTGTQMTRATKKKPATLERCRSCKGEGRR